MAAKFSTCALVALRAPSRCLASFPLTRIPATKLASHVDHPPVTRLLSSITRAPHSHLPTNHSFSTMAPKKGESGENYGNEKGDNGQHQHQAGDTTHREEDQWKFRAPYKVQENDSNFKAVWKAQCHCGKVKYELSREKPLAAKYCHCTTCQRLHGVSVLSSIWCDLY